MIDESKYPDRELLELTGYVGYGEFEVAPNHAKERLRVKLRELPALSDEHFVDVTEDAIHLSVLMSRFDRNWNHIHCCATARYHQSELRKVMAGHLKDCRARSLYSTAYENVARQQGIGVRDDYPACECPDVKGK